MMTGCTCQAARLAERTSRQRQTSAVSEDVAETCLSCQIGAGDECEKLTECELRTQYKLTGDVFIFIKAAFISNHTYLSS